MASKAQITIDTSKAPLVSGDPRRFRIMESVEQLFRTEFSAASDRMIKDATKGPRKKDKGSNPFGQGTLRRNSGALASTISWNVKREGDKRVIGEAGVLRAPKKGRPARLYAGIHEFGTRGRSGKRPDIKPRNSKYLFIPRKSARFPSGVPRFSGKDLKAGRVAGIARTYLLPKKKGAQKYTVMAVPGEAKQSKKPGFSTRGSPTLPKRQRQRKKPFAIATLQKRVAIPFRPFVSPQEDVIFKRLVPRIQIIFDRELGRET